MNKTEFKTVIREYNFQQMHINATHGPACFGKFRKIADCNSNWDIYYNTRLKCFESIAKENSGAANSYFGNKSHILKCIQNGWINEKQLTKFGRRLLFTDAV